MKNKQQGVTLTELLTVIVIIGILASVVLVSLDYARQRARDSVIQQQMSELRNIAEATWYFVPGYSRLEDMVGVDNSELEKIKEQIEDVASSDVKDDPNKEVFNIEFTGDSQKYCAYAYLVTDIDEVICVDNLGNVDRGEDSDFECYNVSKGGGDGEVSCEEYDDGF